MNATSTQSETQPDVLERFSSIVAKSVHIEPAQVVPEAYLDDLGVESLDLIEISMEAETQFNIWLPEKSILDTAIEVFGPGVLENDGYLTAAGKQLMLRRIPESDEAIFEGDVAVKDLRRYFMKVGTWVRMIQSLMEQTPAACGECGGALQATGGLRLKCGQCGVEVALRSGEDLNREWVQEVYEREYRETIGNRPQRSHEARLDLGREAACDG